MANHANEHELTASVNLGSSTDTDIQHHTDLQARPALSPSELQHDSAPAEVDETGRDSWLIKDAQGKETADRFGKYLEDQDRQLAQFYKLFWRMDQYTLRTAFAMFIIEKGSTSDGVNCSINTSLLLPLPRMAQPPQTWKSVVKDAFHAKRRGAIPWDETMSSALYQLSVMLSLSSRSALHLIFLARSTSTGPKSFPYMRMNRTFAAIHERSILPMRLLIQMLKFSGFSVKNDTNSKLKSYKYLPSRLDVILPSQKLEKSEERTRFAWPRDIPLSGRSQVYIWQTYKQPADFEDVELIVEHCEGSLTKVLLIFDTDGALGECSEHYKSLVDKDRGTVQADDPAHISQAQVDRLKYALYRRVIDRIQAFLVETLCTIYEHELEARDNPSRTRFLYLTQLKDYVQRMQEETERCLNCLKQKMIQTSSLVTQQMLQDLESDGVYLLEKLSTSLLEIAHVREEFSKYSNFKQTQHSSLMGLLVSLYVPMAFITSYFGMNTTEINGSAWPLSTFWQTAVPLTVATIVIPITFGFFLRTITRFIRRIIPRTYFDMVIIGNIFLGGMGSSLTFSVNDFYVPITHIFFIVAALLAILRMVRNGNSSKVTYISWSVVAISSALCICIGVVNQVEFSREFSRESLQDFSRRIYAVIYFVPQVVLLAMIPVRLRYLMSEAVRENSGFVYRV